MREERREGEGGGGRGKELEGGRGGERRCLQHMNLRCSISLSQQQDKWIRKKLKMYLKTTECSELN